MICSDTVYKIRASTEEEDWYLILEDSKLPRISQEFSRIVSPMTPLG